MGDDEHPPAGTPSSSVVDPYGSITVSGVSTAAPPPAPPHVGTANALTLFVPTASTTLSLGAVGPKTGSFEFPVSEGVSLATTEDVAFEIGGDVKGHVAKDVDMHVNRFI